MAKNILRRPAVLLLMLSVGLLLLPVNALAQTLSPEKQAEVQRHCSEAQNILGQIQRRDAVSRINRGRSYDQLLRQISAFNSRLAYNKVNQPQFIQTTSDLQVSVDQFRAIFTRYDEYLTNATRLNCKEKPVEFYDLIVKVREERAGLATTVAKVDESIAKYRTLVVDYQKSLETEAAQ